jgi:hypothetical protein
VSDAIVRAALNWSLQKADFERDGSLRDIYVQNATIDDWKIVIASIQLGRYGAQLHRDGVEVAMPASIESLFVPDRRPYMNFTVAGVAVDCHFFTPTEIEFSFDPQEVTERSLHDRLAFMIDLGNLTNKPVIMTPENYSQSPIFRYEPNQQNLSWLSPINILAKVTPPS